MIIGYYLVMGATIRGRERGGRRGERGRVEGGEWEKGGENIGSDMEVGDIDIDRC